MLHFYLKIIVESDNIVYVCQLINLNSLTIEITMQEQSLIDKQKYMTMKELSYLSKYDIPYHKLQDIFAQRNKNGLDEHTIQIGRRIFVSEIGFEKWYESFKKGD